MARPFKDRPNWVMGFLTSSERRVNCIWFRAAGVLLPIVRQSNNPQLAETSPEHRSRGAVGQLGERRRRWLPGRAGAAGGDDSGCNGTPPNVGSWGKTGGLD